MGSSANVIKAESEEKNVTSRLDNFAKIIDGNLTINT